ncbi:unnamed protein product [Arctogadus glacialis]
MITEITADSADLHRITTSFTDFLPFLWSTSRGRGLRRPSPLLLFTLKLVTREPLLNFEDYKLFLKLSKTCDQGVLRNSRNSYFGKYSRVDQGLCVV